MCIGFWSRLWLIVALRCHKAEWLSFGAMQRFASIRSMQDENMQLLKLKQMDHASFEEQVQQVRPVLAPPVLCLGLRS